MRKFSIGKTIMTEKGFGYQTPMLPYEQLKKDFEDTVRNKKIFESEKIKIITGQTGLGKSYYQDKEMPILLKEVFPQLKFIIRISPTTEVSDDGTFKKVDELDTDGIKFVYVNTPDPHTISTWDRFENVVVCITTTHTYFTTHFDRFKEIAPRSVMIIEEAHQFIGCGKAGGDSYIEAYGYWTQYAARTANKYFEWLTINPRILGFTATPTRHHEGLNDMSEKFVICNELLPKKDLIASQAWLSDINQFHFAKFQGTNSISRSIHDSIERIFEKEDLLKEIKDYEDPRINTKLTGLYTAGIKTGAWGSTIDETREVIAKYLSESLNFEENEKMIATMTESSIKIYDLKGQYITIVGNDSEELIRRLEDPDNPLRFVIVINRGRSGINVHNFATEVICRMRDPKEIRTLIPIQMFGRCIRINVGTGNIIRKEFKNNITEYILGYSKKYNVPIETIIETIKISNTFDIWMPQNDKIKRTWQESITHFKKDYVNLKDVGYAYLDQFIEVEKPPISEFLPLPLTIERECNGEMVEYDVTKDVEKWVGDGTLNPLFNIGV